MLVKTNCEKATTKKFKAKLKPYHHHFHRCSKAVAVHHGRSGEKVRLGDLVTIPDSDLHHVMEADAILAISHAIEDVASEERQGELIATFQNFDNFLPHKTRYMSLAEDLDAVRVWGCGKPPQKCGKVDFIVADDPKLLRYWLVLFDSPNTRAVLLCKQVNKAGENSRTKSSSASTASIPIWCSRSAGASTCSVAGSAASCRIGNAVFRSLT